jgi:salicylate hydroxylase|tara:strand:- start:20169 stop:21359 length:1191 start_codon:yes stop_codon:yes gene_type:complete
VKNQHVLITGGGIGGLTAALCLAKQGHRIDLFEQAASFEEIGAGIQLSPNCSRVLHHLGLQESLKQFGFLPEGTQLRHWKTSAILSESKLGDAATLQFGAPYYHIHRGDLLRLLVDAASQQQNISLHLSCNIENFSQNDHGVLVEANNQSFKGDLLIGADGIHSKIRASLWGDESPRFTGNIAWRAVVPTHLLAPGIVKPMSTAWLGPHKHFVHYYVKGGEFVNCVCVVEKKGWQTESWTEPGNLSELKSDFHGWHNNIQQLIDNIDEAQLFKWALHDRRPMTQWAKRRVTLLGDACHPTLPFMAQGAAMAIEDSMVIADCLSVDTSVNKALQHYEQLRKRRTAAIQNGSRRNAKVFHLSGIPAWLRNRAMKTSQQHIMKGIYQYDATVAVASNPL